MMEVDYLLYSTGTYGKSTLPTGKSAHVQSTIKLRALKFVNLGPIR